MRWAFKAEPGQLEQVSPLPAVARCVLDSALPDCFRRGKRSICAASEAQMALKQPKVEIGAGVKGLMGGWGAHRGRLEGAGMWHARSPTAFLRADLFFVYFLPHALLKIMPGA